MAAAAPLHGSQGPDCRPSAWRLGCCVCRTFLFRLLVSNPLNGEPSDRKPRLSTRLLFRQFLEPPEESAVAPPAGAPAPLRLTTAKRRRKLPEDCRCLVRPRTFPENLSVIRKLAEDL